MKEGVPMVETKWKLSFLFSVISLTLNNTLKNQLQFVF